MNIFRIIDLSLKTKQGVEHPDELLSETSFAFIEGFFIIGGLVFLLFTGLLGFAAFHYHSYITLFFAWMFFSVLVFDVYLYLLVKKLIDKVSKKIVNSSKKVIIDIEAKIK